MLSIPKQSVADPRHAKILVIRFSSIGDVVQFMTIPYALRRRFVDGEVHWVTRADFVPLLQSQTDIAHLWAVDRGPWWTLWHMARRLRRERFTHIYDGHNNIRSRLLVWFLLGPGGLARLWRPVQFVRRSKYRWRRWLLFRWRINRYPVPFTGQWSLLEPLRVWGVPDEIPQAPILKLSQDSLARVKSDLDATTSVRPLIALAPSASYPLKRWPLSHWIQLVQEMKEARFVLLGGPNDHYLHDIFRAAPDRCVDRVGRWSLAESSAAIDLADLVIASDTGLLHVAEQLGKRTVAFMGPAPFGYPCRPTTHVLERSLPCRPCSKHGEGPCRNPRFQECLQSITPQQAAQAARDLLQAAHSPLVAKEPRP